jgi:uncharacterized protein YggT (Ycf19 family)
MIFLLNFLVVIRQIIIILVFLRVIFSWFGYRNKYVFDTTEWLLGPIGKIIPPVGGVLDFSPILALLILQYGGDLVLSVLSNMS